MTVMERVKSFKLLLIGIGVGIVLAFIFAFSLFIKEHWNDHQNLHYLISRERARMINEQKEATAKKAPEAN